MNRLCAVCSKLLPPMTAKQMTSEDRQQVAVFMLDNPTLSIGKVGKHFNITRSAVYYVCNEFGLSRSKFDEPDMTRVKLEGRVQ